MTDIEFKHPSYGLVSFSRRSGNPFLFGSNLDTHYNYITLAVKPATLIRGEHGDRFNGPVSGTILEVDLTEAQFAELITTMNVGLGAPCTIRRLNNVPVESPPKVPNEASGLKETFEKDMRKLAKKVMGDSLDSAKAILEKNH